jgi:broad specificity phosphatase PhoE
MTLSSRYFYFWNLRFYYFVVFVCLSILFYIPNIMMTTAVAAAAVSKNQAPSKILYIVRHGQALHNPRAEAAKAAGCSMEEFVELMRQDDALDADLTELGREQARQCHDKHFRALLLSEQKVQLVVSSSLSRAIETAELVYPAASAASAATAPASHVPRISLEHFREVNGKLLNGKRRSKSFLKDRFPLWNFDLLVSEEDDSWTVDMEPLEAAAERGYQGLSWLLSEREEDSILLVSHGGILRYTMNIHPAVHVSDERCSSNGNHSGKSADSRFDNCEVRKYCLCWKEDDIDGEASSTAQKRPILLTQLDH